VFNNQMIVGHVGAEGAMKFVAGRPIQIQSNITNRQQALFARGRGAYDPH